MTAPRWQRPSPIPNLLVDAVPCPACGAPCSIEENHCQECGTEGLLPRAEKLLGSRSEKKIREAEPLLRQVYGAVWPEDAEQATTQAASVVTSFASARADARKGKPPTYAQIRRTITGVCRKHLGKDLGDHRFYTPKEWAARGEAHLNKSLLCLTFEGPIYDLINMNVRGGGKFVDEMTEALSKIGVYYELGYAWCLGVYPI